MASITVDHSGTPHFESKNPQTKNWTCQERITANEILDKGCSEYGCSHYRRRCRIRAPCCNEIFDCRHCHNEAKNNMEIDQNLRHDVPRHQIEKVICSLCGTEQEVQQTSKEQYHCNACGICRIGGAANFFHCDKCACCYAMCMKSSHLCVERAMHHNCPICLEYIFDSRDDVICLLCGHTMHKMCFEDMLAHNQYTCPLCSMSVGDMSEVWEKLDEEIAATPMPAPYEDRMVGILCNDCRSNSEVMFHFVGLKCPNCKSYNTRQTSG
ncbi:CHY-type/CTCHY-type/RING-type Zinc finger protein [Forsythia ovata]|uniref:CHY-type/CTCHY-type/RING-type Zinc finger protein n=1 Tax=Forsythia ovata TaxID=205694 RepID=A0ABD1W243_9LAMI